MTLNKEPDSYGIVGWGYVGKGTELLLRTAINRQFYSARIHIFDTDKSLCTHNIFALKDLANCKLIFVCVPTPMQEDGTCYTDIVDSVVNDLKSYGVDPWRIIIRSTVTIGTAERLGVNFMPEFLTERNWKQDVLESKDLVFGVDNNIEEFKTELKPLFKFDFPVHEGSFYKYHILSTKEAELIKYVRNSFLATKVAFFNEINEYCEKVGLDYNNIKEGVCIDKRIGFAHTAVPGPDGKKGFGGTCLPKDVNSFNLQMKKNGVNTHMVSAALDRNKIDRPEEDWKEDKGRAVI